MAPKKQPATVKLIDEDVIEIVRVLGRFKSKDIAPDGTMREIAALDQPALAPIVARFELLQQSKLAELTREYIAARSRWNTCTGEITAENAARDTRTAAIAVANHLGHFGPAMQGSITGGIAFECRQCGATGRADLALIGTIFSFKCGVMANLAAALKPEPCKACETRREHGLDGQCPSCANERSASLKLISLAHVERIKVNTGNEEIADLCLTVLRYARSATPLPADVARRRHAAHAKLSALVASGEITIQ